MPMQQPNSKIQVRLTVCDNEPLARLAEQRLQQEHITCVVSSLGPGPGGWGVATFLPHAIYVKATDEMHARQVLGVTPAEIEEREPTPAPPHRRRSIPVVVVLIFVAGALLLGTIELAVKYIIR